MHDGHLFPPGAVMQIYYPSLEAIEQQTRQLDHEQCSHCKQTHQLVSHGFIRKKKVGGEPEAVGKRVFCSNRHQYTGCGRTLRLYLSATVRYFHFSGTAVVAFVLSLISGLTIHHAYQHATGTATPKNAYRWLNRLCAQLSIYRSLAHQPPLQNTADTVLVVALNRRLRLLPLLSTFKTLMQQFGQPLCAAYQGQLQRSLL